MLRRWNVTEDDAVIAAVLAGDAAGATRTNTYEIAAASMPGRSERAISHRVVKLMASGRLSAAPLAARASGWTVTEDDAVIAAVLAGDAAGAMRTATYAAAAASMPGRSATAISLRVWRLMAAGRLPASLAQDGDALLACGSKRRRHDSARG